MSIDIEYAEKRFAERLRSEREKARISQLDLSLKAGLSQNLINFIETGKRTPTLHTIFKICNALNINPGQLFLDVDQDKQDAKEKVLSLIHRYM